MALPVIENVRSRALDVPTFNYFLPRIFEAWAHHRHYLPEIIPSRISVVQKGWSTPQRAAVERFVAVLMDAMNDLSWSAVWESEFEHSIRPLKAVLPGLRSVRFVLHDSGAVNDGQISE